MERPKLDQANRRSAGHSLAAPPEPAPSPSIPGRHAPSVPGLDGTSSQPSVTSGDASHSRIRGRAGAAPGELHQGAQGGGHHAQGRPRQGGGGHHAQGWPRQGDDEVVALLGQGQSDQGAAGDVRQGRFREAWGSCPYK